MFGYDANGYYGTSELISRDEEKKVAPLVVKRVENALFYTSAHKVQIWVGNALIAESAERQHAMRDDEMRAWVRDQIQQNRAHLTWLDVDVRAEFVKFGGNANDLYMY